MARLRLTGKSPQLPRGNAPDVGCRGRPLSPLDFSMPRREPEHMFHYQSLRRTLSAWRLLRRGSVFLVAILLGTGCLTAPSTPSAGPVRTCIYAGGPLTDETLGCRLLQLSDSDKLPRRLSESEAASLVLQFRHLEAIVRTGSPKQLVDAEISKTDQMCKDLTGMPFDQLFFSGTAQP